MIDLGQLVPLHLQAQGVPALQIHLPAAADSQEPELDHSRLVLILLQGVRACQDLDVDVAHGPVLLHKGHVVHGTA